MQPKMTISRAVIYAALILFALYFLFPLYVMLSTSFKDVDQLRTGNLLTPPTHWTIDPWIKAWSGACTGVRCDGMQPFFMNSVRMVIPAVLISSIVGAFNGYVLTHWRFRGADAVFTMLLVGCFIPFQAILLPMARLQGMLGLANTTTGLVLVHVVYGIAFTTMFFRNTLRQGKSKARAILLACADERLEQVVADRVRDACAIIGDGDCEALLRGRSHRGAWRARSRLRAGRARPAAARGGGRLDARERPDRRGRGSGAAGQAAPCHADARAARDARDRRLPPAGLAS